MSGKRILVAPLNWGLGHATRCTPLIRLLLARGHTVSLASDGIAGIYLRQEFPELQYTELPSYQIKYPTSHVLLHWLGKIPQLKKTINLERNALNKLVKSENLEIVISDNRYGLVHARTKNVIVTHQLRLLLGPMISPVVNRRLKKLIQQFDQCWIPDWEGDQNLSGHLSDVQLQIPTYSIGLLSRFKSLIKGSTQYDVSCIISGPEPHRAHFTHKVRSIFENSHIKVAFVLGRPDLSRHDLEDHYYHLPTLRLNQLIQDSEIIISRSGYSSIMDYFRLNKKAILVPTPDQPEQRYLAQRLGTRPEFYVPNRDLSDLEVGIESLRSVKPDLQFPQGISLPTL